MNLSTISNLIQRAVPVLLVFASIAFGVPIPVFSEQPPVSTNETGTLVPTKSLDDLKNNSEKPNAETESSSTVNGSLGTSIQLSEHPLSPPTLDEKGEIKPSTVIGRSAHLKGQSKIQGTEATVNPNRTEKTTASDENGNEVAITEIYRAGALQKRIAANYGSEGDLDSRSSERYSQDGKLISKTVTSYDSKGNKVSRERDQFKYRDRNSTGIAQVISTLMSWVNRDQSQEKITIDFNGAGVPVRAAHILNDGSKILYGKDQLEILQGSAGDEVVLGEGETLLWKNEAKDGSWKAIVLHVIDTGTSTKTTISSELLAQAKQVLGDQVASGITTPAPENLPDAGSSTIFYDADGNIVGKFVSGFFAPEGEPNEIWYKYENGQYVKIGEEPEIGGPLPLAVSPEQLDQAKKILGDAVASGIIQVPDPGIADAPTIERFYDTDGNLVGEYVSGGFKPVDYPFSTWSLVDTNGKRLPILDTYSDGRTVKHIYGEDYETLLELASDGSPLSAERVYSDGRVAIYSDLQVQAEVFYLVPNSETLWSQGRGTKTSPTLPKAIIGILKEVQFPDGSKTLYTYGTDFKLTSDITKDGGITKAILSLDSGAEIDVTDFYDLLKTEPEALARVTSNVADLETQLGISGLAIKLTDLSQETWSNGCVGWYSSGMACTQTIVTDYRSVFEIGGISFEYHAGKLDPEMGAILQTVTGIPEADRLQAIQDALAQQATVTTTTK